MDLSRSAYPQSRHAACVGPVVVIDNYLAQSEASALLEFAIESAYQAATALPAEGDEPLVYAGYRRGWVSYPVDEIVRALDRKARATVTQRLADDPKEVYRDELDVHLVASRDGDYFRPHNDCAHRTVKARKYTYVYYLHREPRRFRNGRLLIYPGDTPRAVRARPSHTIEPLHNRFVAFPARLYHESQVVIGPQLEFADSRFSIVGWLSVG